MRREIVRRQKHWAVVLACTGIALLPPRIRDRARGLLLDLEARVPLGAPAAKPATPPTPRERALEAKLALLEADHTILERALEEANAVREVTAAWKDVRAIPAEIVPFAGPEGLMRRIALGRGARDGVVAGAPVLEGPALVGLVAQATRERCEVRLETDPGFRLRVTAPRACIEGVLAGNGTAVLTFTPACNPDDDPALALQPGDVLVASRASSLCALPAIVGTVREVSRPKGESFARALVDPATQASRLDSVVVLRRPDDELARATPEAAIR